MTRIVTSKGSPFAPAGLLLLGLVVAACSPTGAVVEVRAPAPGSDGLDGADGPRGVSRVPLTFQSRVEDRVELEVTFPSVAGGALDRAATPAPAIVLVQGGLVGVARYRWLAEHYASRGYVVIAPSHVFDLALFTIDNARAAVDALRVEAARGGSPLEGAVAGDGPVGVTGHSLGGVVAANAFFSDGRFGALALLASYPADGVDLRARPGVPVLSISGAEDKKATPESVRSGFARLPAPRWLAFVEGMIHYDWTDGASASELASDGTPTRPRAETRRAALAVLDSLWDGWLRRDDAGQARLAGGLFTGVSVTE